MVKKHIVSFSGGLASFFAAARVVDKYGVEDVELIFCDTKSEDEDLYRFVDQAVSFLGAPLTVLCEGRSIWEVYKTEGMMGNSRVDLCSSILKRQLFWKYIDENYFSKNIVIYYGFTWLELDRFERLKRYQPGYRHEAPLIEPPYLDRKQMRLLLEVNCGIRIPRLYMYGLEHNNCGGFCIKAGKAHFYQLYKNFPERYKELEEKELEVYSHIGKKHPFVRHVSKGKTYYLTLKELREDIFEGDPKAAARFLDYGGCGCF